LPAASDLFALLVELVGVRRFMLVAVLDDTGTHGSSGYCSCVGVVTGLRHWERFEREWTQCLTRYGVTDLHAERFYARDDRGNRVKPYRGWDDEKAHSFIRDMMALFGSMKARIIGATVDTAAFYSLPEEERAFWTGQMVDNQTGEGYTDGAPNKPFLLAFAITVHEAFRYGKFKKPVTIVLDQSDAFAKQAAMYWYKLYKLDRYPDLVQGFHPASRKKVVTLQLADLAAYLWNRGLTKGKLTAEQAFAVKHLRAKWDHIARLDSESLAQLRSVQPELFELINARKSNATGKLSATPPSSKAS
jgi:hypothetical protein